VSLLRPRKHARHAKPSAAAPVLAAGTLTAALVVAEGALVTSRASADAAPTAATFDRLAACESGGNWGIDTGNGYYGGLQFSLSTWRGVGGSGYPHQHSRETQIAAGQRLQAKAGWGQWPACARKLGLRGGGGSSAAAAAPAAAPKKAARSRTAAVSAGQVPFDGTVTSSAPREDVRAWQARMRQRGWTVGVDGRFGPQSASVARRFAAQKGLANRPGTLGAVVYGAAWSLPVT
jgi:hypothetical protein